MKKRKWSSSEEAITSIHEFVMCVNCYGGVWWAAIRGGKFMNASWAVSQQLHWLLERIRQKQFFYPKLNSSTLNQKGGEK